MMILLSVAKGYIGNAASQQLQSSVNNGNVQPQNSYVITCVLAVPAAQYTVTAVRNVKWKKTDLKPKKTLDVVSEIWAVTWRVDAKKCIRT